MSLLNDRKNRIVSSENDDMEKEKIQCVLLNARNNNNSNRLIRTNIFLDRVECKQHAY